MYIALYDNILYVSYCCLFSSDYSLNEVYELRGEEIMLLLTIIHLFYYIVSLMQENINPMFISMWLCIQFLHQSVEVPHLNKVTFNYFSHRLIWKKVYDGPHYNYCSLFQLAFFFHLLNYYLISVHCLKPCNPYWQLWLLIYFV